MVVHVVGVGVRPGADAAAARRVMRRDAAGVVDAHVAVAVAVAVRVLCVPVRVLCVAVDVRVVGRRVAACGVTVTVAGHNRLTPHG